MTKSLQLLNDRISAKRYVEDFKLNDDQKTQLLESIRLAPSSFGLEPFRAILIENKEIRKEIQPAWWNQVGVTQSSALLIWVGYKEEYLTKTHFIEQTERNIPNGFENIREMMIGGATNVLSTLEMSRDEWVARQAYISLGTVLNTAQELDLDVCPSEGFSAKEVGDVLAKHNLLDLENEKVLLGMFIGKVDTNQEFYHSFTKTRRPAQKAYSIVE
ncbi:nitroreductase family protein [Spiroplasma diminutum]|uniref:Nitroreductase n=1 Tax=Spiroplasma diminutum CUAS-1 TaxID=1276221 RepID=S5M2C9_9MOLU|nr:nitroreductase family protein [Spiroplasma diminutum]AGR42222.1 nitroreductase [Spiroplasma diminutum CUAS-1]